MIEALQFFVFVSPATSRLCRGLAVRRRNSSGPAILTRAASFTRLNQVFKVGATAPIFRPEGTPENSPMFQHWVPAQVGSPVPKGRLNGCPNSGVPSGLRNQRLPVPTLKRWAIIGAPSGTGGRFFKVAPLRACRGGRPVRHSFSQAGSFSDGGRAGATAPIFRPEGTPENSPMFQHWVPAQVGSPVPKGRLNGCPNSGFPSGLGNQRLPVPTLKRWAIIGGPSGTGGRFFKVAPLRYKKFGDSHDMRPLDARLATLCSPFRSE